MLRQEGMAVQESQFWNSSEIVNQLCIRVAMFAFHEPDHVAPNEAVVSWGVNVVRRVLMVAAVFGSPPKRASLHAHVSHHGTQELHSPRCLEGAMREVTMIERGNTKYLHDKPHATAAGLHPTQITARQAKCNKMKMEN